MFDFNKLPLPDKEAFEAVCKDLEKGNPLTFRHVGAIFGPAFWEILVLSLMDSKQPIIINVGDSK